MNCIDAIEGVAKDIISGHYSSFLQGQLDDTEYARNVKSVIDGTDDFIQKNLELVSDPELLKLVLYSFSKDLWLQETNVKVPTEPEETHMDEDYFEYYFDHIYNNGTYPL